MYCLQKLNKKLFCCFLDKHESIKQYVDYYNLVILVLICSVCMISVAVEDGFNWRRASQINVSLGS